MYVGGGGVCGGSCRCSFCKLNYCMLLFSYMQVACGGCHTMVMASKRQGDEDEFDLLDESLDKENEVCNLWNSCIFTT